MVNPNGAEAACVGGRTCGSGRHFCQIVASKGECVWRMAKGCAHNSCLVVMRDAVGHAVICVSTSRPQIKTAQHELREVLGRGEGGEEAGGVAAGEDDLGIGSALAILGDGSLQGAGEHVVDPGADAGGGVVAEEGGIPAWGQIRQEGGALGEGEQAHTQARQDAAALEAALGVEVDGDGGAGVDDDAVLMGVVQGGGQEAAAAVEAEAVGGGVGVGHVALEDRRIGFAHRDAPLAESLPPGLGGGGDDAAQENRSLAQVFCPEGGKPAGIGGVGCHWGRGQVQGGEMLPVGAFGQEGVGIADGDEDHGATAGRRLASPMAMTWRPPSSARRSRP